MEKRNLVGLEDLGSANVARLLAYQARDEAKAKRMEQMAYGDDLTGLKNRRFYDEMIGREVARGKRREGNNEEYVFSLIIGDIDKFKVFNDTYGHLAGDKVLTEVGGIFNEMTGRPTDTAARYGGEEIAVILPETDHEGALIFAERLRSKIEESVLDFEDKQGKAVKKAVNVSMGVSTFRSGDDAETMFERSDRRLYAAKEAGRNRVVGRDGVYTSN